MIKNNWKKLLQKSYRSQNGLADQIGMGRDIMSRACSGIGLMPYESLEACCAVLECEPTDIYDAETLSALYQVEHEARKKKQPSTVCVRIRKEFSDFIDGLVEDGMYESRNEAVNAILRSKLL